MISVFRHGVNEIFALVGPWRWEQEAVLKHW